MSMGQNIAVVGAGLMGSAIVTRLLERGHAVQVFDIDAARIVSLAARGARLASSIAEASRNSDFIILSLNHADTVR
jgi:2-hydroxy-3-oxopropionate reductase